MKPYYQIKERTLAWIVSGVVSAIVSLALLVNSIHSLNARMSRDSNIKYTKLSYQNEELKSSVRSYCLSYFDAEATTGQIAAPTHKFCTKFLHEDKYQ